APHPDAQPLTGKTLPRGVPDLSAAAPSVPASPRPAPRPSVTHDPTLLERTLPMPAQDLSAVSSPAASSPPMPLAPPDFLRMERTLPMPAPDLSAAFQAVGPQPSILGPPLQPDPALAVEPAGTPGAVSRARKSKLIPILFGVVAVAILAEGIWGYW